MIYSDLWGNAVVEAMDKVGEARVDDPRARLAEYAEIVELSPAELAARHDPELVKQRFRAILAAAEGESSASVSIAGSEVLNGWADKAGSQKCVYFEDGLEVFHMAGHIKWFDASKGYGFIVPDNGLEDVLLHVTSLRAAGFETAVEGARVIAQCMVRKKGPHVFRILHLDNSTGIHPSQFRIHPVLHVRAESAWVRAMVKWFNRVRGFGFLTIAEGREDLFIHMETLRRYGFTELRPGQVIQVRWGQGPKGRTVAEIRTDGSPRNWVPSH